MKTPNDYMTQAFALAQLGRYSVSPNPMVGCLIVKNNQIVGQGYHQKAGQPHAEIHALNEAKEEARGATAYITLEPCSHTGRTPPCTDALIKSGIKQVYVACLDPNPLVSGKGVASLQSAGIQVEVGLDAEKAKQLNERFFHYITKKRPFVIAKWAMSLDGKTTTHVDDDRKISNAVSHQHSHEIRQSVDAILIGANTAVRDNPLLTVRTETPAVRQPLRVVLSSRGGLPLDLNVFPALVITTDNVDRDWLAAAQQKQIDVAIVKKNELGQVDLYDALEELGKREITSVLVEGGMTVLESFFQEDLVNQVHVYLAPTIIGKLNKKRRVLGVHQSKLEEDNYFFGEIKCLAE